VKRFFILSSLFAAYSINAMAAINLSFVGTTPSGTDTQWDWTASLSGDSRLDNTTNSGQPSSFFTIYDIGGIISGIIVPNNTVWTSSVQPLGVTPSSQIVATDQAATQNVTFTYISPTATTSVQGLGGEVQLGTFSIITSSNVSRIDTFSYRANDTAQATIQAGQANTTVPGLTRNEVPEPATMGMMSGALAGLVLMLRRRK
jgi:hypothetical protein